VRGLRVLLWLFFEVFFYSKIYIFYFLKIIFDISASKLPENIQIFINLKNKNKKYFKNARTIQPVSFFLVKLDIESACLQELS